MNTETKQRGFTIVEMIVAIAIFSILIMLIVLVSTQILAMTTKMQSRDKSMAIAQRYVEKMRGDLIVPDQFGPSETPSWPGYSVTITSSLVTTTSGLRDVLVSVQNPYSQSPIQLHTYIYTYRPRVSFIFPITNIAYIRDVDPLLEGWARDDGNTITKIEYRLGSGGTWGSWITLTSFYHDVNRQSVATLPSQIGQTVFFTIPIVGSGNDGTVQEIQVQATNSGTDPTTNKNEQPSQPFGGTSYVRLITDKTKPTATTTLFLTTSITTGSTPTLRVTASDTTSGVNNVFAVVSKTPSAGSKTYLHGIPETTPHWASDIYYNTTAPNDVQLEFVLPTGTLTYEPWTEYSFQAYVLDNVIGKYYNYLTLIPAQGISPGVDYLWPNVTANFYQTATITRMMHPKPTIITGTAAPVTATTATLRGSVNPGGLDSTVWFEYKSTSESQWNATVVASKNGVVQVDFTKEATNLLPATSYTFRACVSNDWGTYYGNEIPFTTAAGTTP